jgi:histone demethylase JARID1
MFPSILDPSVLCLYLSEVLDGGQEGPIFKVKLQELSMCSHVTINSYKFRLSICNFICIMYFHVHFQVSMKTSPSEMFVHLNIDKCWQMVQERVNMSIRLHHTHHRVALSHFCLPTEIDGYKLFGFTTPHIIKVSFSLSLSQISFL